jgi:hypothetical protein
VVEGEAALLKVQGAEQVGFLLALEYASRAFDVASPENSMICNRVALTVPLPNKAVTLLPALPRLL